MRSLQQARQRARACRDAMGHSPEELLERITRYLLDIHGIELHRAPAAFLQGSRAEVSPAEGCLFYDEQLDHHPAEKRFVILHELGHLELHPRLQRCCAAPDPVYGTMYLNDGAPALARYNRRSREEAEANAFATEFLCPSRELLQMWRRRAHDSVAHLARSVGAPVPMVHAQLAEALYWHDREEPPPSTPRANGVDCDASQLAAATYTGAPVLVDAGPGTGKTATLVRRVTYLLDERGADPGQLLVLTFSNDAAEELRDRIASQCGEPRARQIEVSTFHGFGVAFLHHHGQFLNLDHDASILDEAAQAELVTELLGRVPCTPIINLHNPDDSVRAIVRHLTYLKDRLYTPDDFAAALDADQPEPEERQRYEAACAFLAVYRAYEETKHARQRVDFADLIALPIRILQQQAALQQAYRDKYRWVMVDEYQDVSRAVASLLRQICGSHNPPWVVGDTRQAIYRFRGAAPENVSEFHHDFPGARVFHLNTNYRSCPAIVHTANQLAGLLQTPEASKPLDPPLWTCGAAASAHGDPAVSIARADSDHAEHDGIAQQIATWLNQGIRAQDIAVLARRNIDVRNIVLTLGRRQVPATTAGLITPEGAAGDLAAIVTLTDQPRASLPRLAFALGRGRCSVETINTAIRHVLHTLAADGTFATDHDDEACQTLATAMLQVRNRLQTGHFSSDAFAMMCTFLFDSGDYLQRILEQPESAERALALSEIITALSRAAGYRFLHSDVEPQASRKGFAQAFRSMLNAGSPALAPPSRAADAVRVMTCHASKGLEFPCVIVAGQTLSRAPREYAWLPPHLAPPVQDDREQADALFFVSATRAQRALVATYASSASGTARSQERDLTPLLSQWRDTHRVPIQELPSMPAPHLHRMMHAVWGGTPHGALSTRAFAPQTCGIRTYLEHYLGVRFPSSTPPLYPLFFDVVRRAMGRIVHLTQARGTPFSHDEAKELFLQEWPISDVSDHPHHALYAHLACESIEQFARAYVPVPKASAHLDLTAHDAATGLALRYDLLALYDAEDGTTVAISLRPESLRAKHREHGLLWSGLSPAHRMSFMLLRQEKPNLQPYVFSAADGVLYPYAWTANANELAKETQRLAQQCDDVARGRFAAKVQEWTCNRCPVRVSCPHWLGALAGEPEP